MSASFPPIDYLASDTLADPFEFYKQARAQSPVIRVARTDNRPDIYLITTHELIREVTQNPEVFSSNFSHLLFERFGNNPAVDAILARGMKTKAGMLLVTDGAVHQRYRALVNNVFTAVRVNQWTPVIERLTDELIDSFIESGECDFVEQFAVRLPTYVIADILGLERGLYDRLAEWSDAIIRFVSRTQSAGEEIASARLVIEFEEFLIDHIQKLRAHPGADLVSALILSRVDGEEPLSDDEIGPMIKEIAVAGNETTRNTLKSGLARLIENPTQMRALVNEPRLMSNAVEEILRYEVPATSMWRVAIADVLLGGVALPKGAAVLLRYDSGNRDEKLFADAETFDVSRKNANQHISFGAPGIHRCLGQMLARKELTVAFQKLLARLSNLRVIREKSDLTYWPALLHRGIGALFLSFDPGKRLGAGTPGSPAGQRITARR